MNKYKNVKEGNLIILQEGENEEPSVCKVTTIDDSYCIAGVGYIYFDVVFGNGKTKRILVNTPLITIIPISVKQLELLILQAKELSEQKKIQSY